MSRLTRQPAGDLMFRGWPKTRWCLSLQRQFCLIRELGSREHVAQVTGNTVTQQAARHHILQWPLYGAAMETPSNDNNNTNRNRNRGRLTQESDLIAHMIHFHFGREAGEAGCGNFGKLSCVALVLILFVLTDLIWQARRQKKRHKNPVLHDMRLDHPTTRIGDYYSTSTTILPSLLGMVTMV